MTGLKMRGEWEVAVRAEDWARVKELGSELLTAFCQLDYERRHRPECVDKDCWCRAIHCTRLALVESAICSIDAMPAEDPDKAK